MRAKAWGLGILDLECFERESYEHVLGIEGEYLAAELARYDTTANEIELAEVSYRPAWTGSETYRSMPGR